MTIGELIKQNREAKKLTPEKLCELSSISVKAIGEYEAEARKPSIATRRVFAKIFELDEETLLKAK